MKQLKRWKRVHSGLQGSIHERASTSLSPPPGVLSSSPQPGGPLEIEKQHSSINKDVLVIQHETPQFPKENQTPGFGGMLPPFPEHWPIQKSDPTKKDRYWSFKELEARAEGRLQ